jgi:hypothetical protein
MRCRPCDGKALLVLAVLSVTSAYSPRDCHCTVALSTHHLHPAGAGELAWAQVGGGCGVPRPHAGWLMMRQARGPRGLRGPRVAAGLVTLICRGKVQEVTVLPEREWRARAQAHRERVRALLEPGFLMKRQRGDPKVTRDSQGDGFWGLDPVNPTYNFLLRYYNIRGASGTRRMAKWSPGLHVILEGGAGPPSLSAIMPYLVARAQSRRGV